MAGDVLATKSAFLRSKSVPLKADVADSLVPRLVFDAPQPPPSDVVDNNNNPTVADNDDDDDDAVADDDDDVVADDAMDIDPNHCTSNHVDPHMARLSNEATAIFPYTIRYLDLTVLKLKSDLLVPQLMLLRNEWGSMIDIFNKRKKGM